MLKKILSLIVTLAVGTLLIAGSAKAAVEINTADQAALDGVAGIGPATSKAILEERKKNGNFRDWPDLEQRVKGIGDKNAVKLSAAGLIVNGQPRQTTQPATQVKPVKAAKTPTEPTKAGEIKN